MKTVMISPYDTNLFNHLNIQILENGIFRGDRRWFFNDVVSDFNRLYFLMDGKGWLTDKNGRYPLVPGKLYLIPAGTQYTYRCPDFVEKFYLHFQLPLFPGKDLFDGIPTFLELDYPEEALQQLLGLLEGKTTGGLLAFKAKVTALLGQFLMLWEARHPAFLSQGMGGYFRQEAVLSYIELHLNNRLKVTEIADALNLPCREMSRAFFEDTGVHLKAYLDRLLLQKAKYFLLATDRTSAEIADLLGFRDAYYFSRFFKKFEEIPPREYRKQHRLIQDQSKWEISSPLIP